MPSARVVSVRAHGSISMVATARQAGDSDDPPLKPSANATTLPTNQSDREAEQPVRSAEREQDLAAQRLQGLDQARRARGSGSRESRSLHFGPSTTSTKSGATMTRPTSAGIEISRDEASGPDPDVGHPLAVVAHPGEGRKEDLLQRSGDARERDEDDVRREQVRADRRGAEEAADQQVAEIAAGLVEKVLAEDVARKAAEPARGSRSRTSATAATA